MRRAKIVATLGPSLLDQARLRAAIEAGVNVVRLNFSHGTHEAHAEQLAQVRKIARSLGRNVGALGDLQGPKIRLGQLPDGGVELIEGGEVVLLAGHEALSEYEDGSGTPVLPVVYDAMATDVEPGAIVLMDDGLLRLVVSRVDGDSVVARVVAGGLARSRKGVNLPGVQVSAPTLTEKDRADVKAMVDLEVDWIALSFVRRAADVTLLRELIHSHGGQAPVVAKLERPESIDNLDEIMDAADAVMVARGDLGVEIGPERVPALQKRIIALANERAKPVITATEMMDSMIRNPQPTRAEASDVANAVFDLTDALMLSGETAAGRFPVEAVRTMSRIIEEAESSQQLYGQVAADPHPGQVLARVVGRAAVQVAQDVNAVAVAVFSISGASAQLVSKFRPSVPLIGLTPSERAYRRMALMWGTDAALVVEKEDTRSLIMAADEYCTERGYGQRGDVIVIVSGLPGGHGGTNRLTVHRLGDLPDS